MKHLAIVAAVASVGLLTGCAAQVPLPETPSSYAVIAASQAQRDATWKMTGLDGRISRPSYRISGTVGAGTWQQKVLDCLSEDGIEPRSFRSENGGYRLVAKRGQELDDGTQFLWYRCFARTPPAPPLASKSELEYLWNNYEQLVIRCGAELGVIER